MQVMSPAKMNKNGWLSIHKEISVQVMSPAKKLTRLVKDLAHDLCTVLTFWLNTHKKSKMKRPLSPAKINKTEIRPGLHCIDILVKHP